ncbi:MAG: tetratricopeptide repeat protein [Planctomycetes bacterium]|nr:tetratricopeptide repeat protein [Planctomycetota bacterium]
MQFGPYQLEQELARGGMGAVYLARGPDGERVAIKLLLEQSYPDPELERRFRREAEALEALDHPGILKVRGHGVERGRLYMVMDLLPGPTLADVVRAEGPLSEARAVALARRMAAALVHAHERGIVHRDLKPENVILRGAEPVLVDFGLVRRLGFDASRLTETGAILGSPKFMAPEQAQGEGDVGPSADLYALGATLYFLLTGKAPFEGESVLAILVRVARDAPRPPRELRPELSPTVEALIVRCLEKDPALRYPTAETLERALAGLQGIAAPGGRTALRLSLVSIGLVAASLGGAGLFLRARGAKPTESREPPQARVDLGERRPGGTEAKDQRSPSEVTARVAELLASVRTHMASGRYAEAIVDCAVTIELDPSCVEALGLRGACHVALEQYLEAIADFDAVLALDPENVNALRGRGHCKAVLSGSLAAVEDFDAALELDPRDAEAYVYRGACRQRLGDYEGARSDYDRAIALEPRHAAAYRGRGGCRAQAGQLEEALEDYDQALGLGLEEVSLRLERGAAYTALGRHREALDEYDAALELDSREPAAYEARGSCWSWLGYPSKALEDYDRAIALDPSRASAYVNRGVGKCLLERDREALEDYDKGIQLDPTLAQPYYRRGLCQVKLEHAREAAADFAKALEIGLPPRDAANARILRDRCLEAAPR